MSTPQPPRKRPPQQPGQRPPAKRGPAPKPKQKGATSAKLVGIMSLAAAVIVIVGVCGYVGQRYMPKPMPSAAPDPSLVVARPSVEPKVENQDPKRPGLALAPPDEIYTPKAHDLKPSDPLEPPINGLLAKGVITTFADGLFRPKEPLPRAEFVVWCYNAVMAQTVPGPDPFIPPKKGISTVEASGEEFKDVPADHWAAQVLASVKHSNVFESVLEKSFRPDAPLTREEWAGFAAGLGLAKEVRAKLPEDLPPTKLAVALRLLSFTDANAVKDPYRGALYLILTSPKTKGWVTDMFPSPEIPGPWNPKKAVTRGEAAVWLGGAYDQIGVGLL